VWICPDCNEVVPEPMKGRRCPKGHGLFDRRIFGATNEQSFGRAFVSALITSAVMLALLIAFFDAFLSRNAAIPLSGMAMFAFAYLGIAAFLRGRHWKHEGGPVTKLVPRANGMAVGYIAAVAALLIVGFITDALR
jgi:hypothetical protein